MNVKNGTIQVSFRLPRHLVKRMREITEVSSWPPPPSQTDIVVRGIEQVLRTLEKGRKVRAEAD